MLKFVHKFRQFRQTVAVFTDIPVYFPVYREFGLETGSHMTAHTSISMLSYANRMLRNKSVQSSVECKVGSVRVAETGKH
jgi:hypothetical protein